MASCDKVQLVYKIRKPRRVDGYDLSPVQSVLDYIAGADWLEYEHWTTRKIGTYREQFSITATADGDTFWLGVGLNGPGLPKPQVKVEFNPNKVWPRQALVRLLAELHRLAKCVELKQWDYAVDWPEPRERFTLVKDARLYEETTHSRADRTQYVGQRNMPGRCKLYNKQIESGLSDCMTRLEMTVGGDAGLNEAAALWPKVYRLGDVQLGADVAQLNDTDRFILGVLLEQPDKLRELGRRKRERMEGLLAGLRYLVEFEPRAFAEVARFARSFMDGQFIADAMEGRITFSQYLREQEKERWHDGKGLHD